VRSESAEHQVLVEAVKTGCRLDLSGEIARHDGSLHHQ
jgi:hypothetical protein